MDTNISFFSNLYTVLKPRLSDYKLDFEAVEHIYDAQKLEAIKKFTNRRLANLQERYLANASVCIEHQRKSKNLKQQCFILKKNCTTDDAKYEIKSVCKCTMTECQFFDTCRPKEREKALKEKEIFKQLKTVKKIDTAYYYPVVRGFKRIKESYKNKAYTLLSNTPLDINKSSVSLVFEYQKKECKNVEKFHNLIKNEKLENHFKKRLEQIKYLYTEGNASSYFNADLSVYAGDFKGYLSSQNDIQIKNKPNQINKMIESQPNREYDLSFDITPKEKNYFRSRGL